MLTTANLLTVYNIIIIINTNAYHPTDQRWQTQHIKFSRGLWPQWLLVMIKHLFCKLLNIKIYLQYCFNNFFVRSAMTSIWLKHDSSNFWMAVLYLKHILLTLAIYRYDRIIVKRCGTASEVWPNKMLSPNSNYKMYFVQHIHLIKRQHCFALDVVSIFFCV